MNRYNTSYVGFPTAFRGLLFPWQSAIYHPFGHFFSGFVSMLASRTQLSSKTTRFVCCYPVFQYTTLPRTRLYTTAYFILLKYFLRKLINHKEISGQYIVFKELRSQIYAALLLRRNTTRVCINIAKYLRGAFGGGGRALPVLRGVHKFGK